MNRIFRPIVLILLTAAPFANGAAQDFKCIAPETETITYGDTPCPAGSRRMINAANSAGPDGTSGKRGLAQKRFAKARVADRYVAQSGAPPGPPPNSTADVLRGDADQKRRPSPE